MATHYTRRDFIKTMGLGLSALSVSGCMKMSGKVNQPNIVVFIADDLGWKDVGFNGSEIKTPTIDRLAQESARLHQFYTMPACTPTRASLLTGRYPIRTGLQVSVVKPTSHHGLPLNERLLPQVLKDNGYYTAITGKWHLGLAQPEYLPTNRGFMHQYGCYTGMNDYFTHKRDGAHDWNRNDKPVHEEGYTTHLIRDEAIKVINNHDKTKPLFLYVPFTAPHIPLQVPEKYLRMYKDAEVKPGKHWIEMWEKKNKKKKLKKVESYDELCELATYKSSTGYYKEFPKINDPWAQRRIYAAMVTCMDEAMGDILTAMEKSEMMENTVVVFLSDNGPAQGANSDPFRGHKTQLYEGGVRAPGFIWWSGHIESRLVDEPLHVVDLYPTLLKIAGASPEQPLPIDGKDIMPTLTGAEPSPHREILLNAREGRSEAIRVGDWKLVVNGHLGPVGTIGDKPDVYELFNIAEDPYEEKNLTATHPEKLTELLERLQHYRDEAVEPLTKDNPAIDQKPALKNWGHPD